MCFGCARVGKKVLGPVAFIHGRAETCEGITTTAVTADQEGVHHRITTIGNVRHHRTAQKCCAYWIVTAIAIEVQTIDGLGIQVGGIVRRDESTPLGRVISGVAVVQSGVAVVVIASVTDDVRSCYIMIIPAPPYFVHQYLFAAKFIHFEG